MAKPKRLKTPTADSAQTREEVAARIRQLGDQQRDLARMEADMNDQIAAITEACQPGIDAGKKRIADLIAQIQPWCESNRADLTDGYKVKTANLITGEIGWRIDPPSVAARGLDDILPQLDSLGLDAYIRTKRELAKEAILADRTVLAGKEKGEAKQAATERLAKLSGVPGITIREGVEQFFITPFEQTTA